MNCGAVKTRLSAIGMLVLFSFSALAQEWRAPEILPGTPVFEANFEPAPLSMGEARALIAGRGEDDFPLVINRSVLKSLNAYLTQKRYRRFFHDALVRMNEMEDTLRVENEEAGTPWELMAIPLIESGFGNPTERANPWHSAGMWQFTRGSARARGLRVEGGMDERLDPVLSTRAALSYFLTLENQLGTWPLAILAYNRGPENVRRALRASSSRDAFEVLAHAPRGGDRDYLAKFMAAAILLGNPQLFSSFD